MKYSLKNQYKKLLREDEDLQYSDNEVRVVFPQDSKHIARIYQTKNNMKASKEASGLDLKKKYTIDLTSVTKANRLFAVNSRSYTDGNIKTDKNNQATISKFIIDQVNQITNKSLLTYLSNSENMEQNNKLTEALKNSIAITEQSFIHSINKINSYSLEQYDPELDDLVDEDDLADDDQDTSDISLSTIVFSPSGEVPYTKKEATFIDVFKSMPENEVITIEAAQCIPHADKNLISGSNKHEFIIKDLKTKTNQTCKKIIEFIVDQQINVINAKINSNDRNHVDFTEENYTLEALSLEQVSLIILNEYCGNISIPQFKHDIKTNNINQDQIRKELNSKEEAINYLNDHSDKFLNYEGKGGKQGEVKGAGEFQVHFLLKTTNAFQNMEPDAIIQLKGKTLPVSVKQYKDVKTTSQTGGKMSSSLKNTFSIFTELLFVDKNVKSLNVAFVLGLDKNPTEKNVNKLIESHINNLVDKISFITLEDNKYKFDSSMQKKCLEAYKKFKKELSTEHDAVGVIAYYNKQQPDGQKRFVYISPDECRDKVSLASVPSNERISFNFCHSGKIEDRQRLDRLILTLLEMSELKSGNSSNSKNESRLPRGKALKEVYSHLFKKKMINEGGLAGHMMHPYEALDMTPRQIIDRIKEYNASQKIIEKVDGQNLFFTVEQDGTLMFARNKEDMTHDDLVAKFTGHGAEKPFVEGGNAIKRGVEQWLQSAGPAAEMEIREIFHPDGETKSFINFEIMHPDKPNQIVYDEKYIVFHSIVDYVDGRKTIHSTNKGQRLEKLIRLMDSGVTANGFTLASNRTVNLNELTNVQIEEYVERVKEVALKLGISEGVTLGEGIENIIKKEIDSLNISLDRKTLKKIYNFVLYGEDRQGNKIKSKDFTSSLIKSDAAGLRSLDLTSANKALKKVQRIISPFKDVFVDLGVDLLKGVKSAYMSDETNQKNIELLRDKLQTAINDLTNYMNEKPENYWETEVHRLRPHLDKVIDKDISDIVATTVEGGVYDYQGDLIKVTGGFAPLNQILGAAYRDKKGIFPNFKQKFMQQESNRRSLKGVFNLIF